jgi:hypothetical protein
MYAWVFQMPSFPEVSTPKLCMHVFTPLYVLHALSINSINNNNNININNEAEANRWEAKAKKHETRKTN